MKGLLLTLLGLCLLLPCHSAHAQGTFENQNIASKCDVKSTLKAVSKFLPLVAKERLTAACDGCSSIKVRLKLKVDGTTVPVTVLSPGEYLNSSIISIDDPSPADSSLPRPGGVRLAPEGIPSQQCSVIAHYTTITTYTLEKKKFSETREGNINLGGIAVPGK